MIPEPATDQARDIIIRDVKMDHWCSYQFGITLLTRIQFIGFVRTIYIDRIFPVACQVDQTIKYMTKAGKPELLSLEFAGKHRKADRLAQGKREKRGGGKMPHISFLISLM